jgi:phage tail-like protein
MAVLRNHPYGRYNFIVTIEGVSASFSEVVLPTAEINVIEYREGADRDNQSRKLPGLTKYTNLVLRRGITGSLELWQWFAATRNGEVQRRKVTITLLREDREPVMTWKLSNCLPVKFTGPAFNARGNEVAIEEVELAVEGLEIE